MFPKYLILPFPWTGPLLWGNWSRTARALLWSLLQGQLSWTQVLDSLGFPAGASGKEPTCQCRRHEELRVQSLGQEDPLEKEMATHSSILAWRMNPMDRGAWRAMVLRVTKSWTQLTDLARVLRFTAAVPPGLKEATLSVPLARGCKSLGSSV